MPLQKTWQLQINQTVSAQGSVMATDTRLLRTLKNLLVGFGSNPWTVRYSCNGTTAGTAGDAVDRWTNDAAIVRSGGAHSWIVLRQTGIASNFEFCIDCSNVTSGWLTMVISPSAGFTGGTTTARPTATDEIVLINNTTWASGAQDVQHQIHAWQSTDGQCTRVAIWYGGTNMCTFMLFDKPDNPVSGWTSPSISFIVNGNATVAATYTGLGSSSGPARGRGTTTITLGLTGESFASSSFLPNLTNIGDTPNESDGTWSQFPIGIASVTTANRGRKGSLFDLWWKPFGLANGTTSPSDASRVLITMGPFILPWTADATAPLLS